MLTKKTRDALLAARLRYLADMRRAAADSNEVAYAHYKQAADQIEAYLARR